MLIKPGRVKFAAAQSDEELELYRGYLETLGMVAGLLLEEASEQNLTEVMRLLAETTGASCCSLFLNKLDESGEACAKLHCTSSPSVGVRLLSDYTPFHELRYQSYPLLSDTLHVGMVLSKQISELPQAEATLFAEQRIHTVLCIPLLVSGEMEGFVGLFSRDTTRNWQPLEIKVLCTIANSLALALVRKRVEQSLAAGATRLRALVGATEDLVIEYDLMGQILNIWTDNPIFALGLNDSLAGTSLQQSLPDDMAQAILLATPRVLDSGNREIFEFTLSIDEEDRFFMGRLQILPSETGQARNLVALIRDATELIQEEARRQSMLETMNLLEEAIVDLSPEGWLLNFSAAWSKLCDIPVENGNKCLGTPLAEYIYPDDRASLGELIKQLASAQKHSDVIRFRLLPIQEDPIWVEARLLAHCSRQGHVIALRGVLRDITSSHLQEQRITQLALHDALTQLPNRILLEDHLQQAIARAERNKTKVALGFIDLDHFKHINDTLGHNAGDTVLVTLSKRLQSVLRGIDTLSRWGGDEFVVLLPDVSNEEDFRSVAERLRDVARDSIDLDGVETKITLSIGFAVYPDDADSPETLMSVADHTMFHAKGIGRNNVQFFQDIHDKTLDRENVQLQTRLNRAIQEGVLQVFYQPVVDVETQRIVTFEALSRWHDDPNGWVAPDVFIPLAEHLGIIQELGEQVFNHSLQRLKSWREMNKLVQASVNISRLQLFAPAFVQNLLRKIDDHGLKPQDIVLEITESVALLDLNYESKRLHELRDAGFSIAIDDFGTGYSSLSQLHKMPVDILKIDTSFTSRLDTEDGRRIVQAIVQMADALSLKMVVEGVEKLETVQYLRSLGVSQMQGHYFSAAVPAGMCGSLLQNNQTLFK